MQYQAFEPKEELTMFIAKPHPDFADADVTFRESAEYVGLFSENIEQDIFLLEAPKRKCLNVNGTNWVLDSYQVFKSDSTMKQEIVLLYYKPIKVESLIS
ncbi:hypothetical protein PCC6912_39760 [Chlorogloeopsis fritschii PCC 6912]|uniref:Uncharacterized protein n=1 Tax=Chlorogloeopsis fritschii PCC 6912 TaxID=211165 RepID=A0A3S1A0Z6_CHLFR|nr:hypothetical protein [Chlorogloeopsis fritschii]RUR77017.1 hypothetical protein PCC6912_39760 [Chlorogloeopsis fritschii PCC 6912]